MAAEAQQRDEEQQMAAQGRYPLPVAAMELATQLITEVRAIRQVLTPPQALHIAALAPVTGPDGQPMGFGCFCLGCSDPQAGNFVFPCAIADPQLIADHWPAGQVLAVIDHGELISSTVSADIPDTVEGAEDGEPRSA